jgi:predicted RNA-binding protein with PUA domain
MQKLYQFYLEKKHLFFCKEIDVSLRESRQGFFREAGTILTVNRVPSLLNLFDYVSYLL